MEVGVDGNIVAVAFRDGQQRIQLHVLDRTFRRRTARVSGRDCLQHLFVGERRQAVRHIGEALHDPERVDVLDDLKTIPKLLDRLVDLARAVGERQDAHHLRKPGVRGGADQQPARLPALFSRMAAEPGSRTPAIPEREGRQIRRLVHAPRLSALAAYDLLRKVAARAAFVEPQRPAARIVRPVDEPIPVDVIDVASPAGADEPRCDHRLLLIAPIGEGGARNQPPRAHARPGKGAGLLRHEPLRKAPRTDPPLPFLPSFRLGRWSVNSRVGNAGHGLKLGRKARLVDHFEIRLIAPGIEAAHDRGVVRQVDEGARAEGGDHLAAAQLSVRSPVHLRPPSFSRLERSRRNRFTCGSTSRSERLVRNFR